MKEVNELNKKTSKTNLQRTSKMYSKERGITLIALVITIIILIILATVTITLVFGEGGLIQRAQEGKRITDQAQKDEQDELKRAEEYINGVVVGINSSEEKSEVEEARKSGTVFENTTTITDDLDNAVTVPGGFNIAEDSGTKVEEGIVIEDSNNNQFVWIPVGEYNVTDKFDLDGMKDGKITNELTRRKWATIGVVAEPTPVSGDSVISEDYYGEGDSRSVAKDQIDAFKNSSTTNKGFYIGRYEAGTEIERTAKTDPLTTPIVQANKYPYVYVTRDNAKTQAEVMYSGDEYVTGELISSYAWDTALNFICQTNEAGYLLATINDSNYGNMDTNNRTQTGAYTINGEASDKYSNIFDILGNCQEWTTEYSSCTNLSGIFPCVSRGGIYYSNILYAADRLGYNTSGSNTSLSFRLQLYINPES